MKMLFGYVLRQGSQPTEPEATDFVFTAFLGHCEQNGLDAPRRASMKDVPIARANPNDPTWKVSEVMDTFISACGGGEFLARTDEYEVLRFETETGEPAASTAIAIVVTR